MGFPFSFSLGRSWKSTPKVAHGGAKGRARFRAPRHTGTVRGRAVLEFLENRRLLSGYSLTTLASFSDAAGPNAAVIDSNGNFFGTTSTGGDNFDDVGTYYEIPVGTNTVHTLARFNGTNGAYPTGALIFDPSGNLYGTTVSGGDFDEGTVFKIAHGTTAITTLASFNGTNGANPYAALVFDSSGNLYGTTSAGGDVNGDGTVFKIAYGTNAIATLALFNGPQNGSFPSALTIDSSGNLYGTTAVGGVNGVGTIFKIAHGTTTITTVASFNPDDDSSYSVNALVIDSSGNLYGSRGSGGPGHSSGFGTVFEVAAMGMIQRHWPWTPKVISTARPSTAETAIAAPSLSDPHCLAPSVRSQVSPAKLLTLAMQPNSTSQLRMVGP